MVFLLGPITSNCVSQMRKRTDGQAIPQRLEQSPQRGPVSQQAAGVGGDRACSFSFFKQFPEARGRDGSVITFFFGGGGLKNRGILRSYRRNKTQKFLLDGFLLTAISIRILVRNAGLRQFFFFFLGMGGNQTITHWFCGVSDFAAFRAS